MKNLQNVLDSYRTAIIFTALALVVTIIFGAIFGTGQQILRSQAEQEQVRGVRQVESVVQQGIPLNLIISSEEAVEMKDSLELFAMTFDANRQVLGTTAKLGEETPTPPENAFTEAKATGEHRFTWEPQEGVRIAAVLKPIGDQGFILAGRSLSETEKLVETLAWCTIIGWAACMLLVLLLTFALKPRRSVAIIEETNVTVVEPSNE